jgi:hypothetical protein
MAKDWPFLKTAAVKPVYNGHPWDSKKWPLHSGLPRGHNKNDKIQKKSYFYQIQSILTLWQKIDFLFFIYF